MIDDIHNLSIDQPWPTVAGLAYITFEHSQGLYWLQYVQPGDKFSKAIRDGSIQFAQTVGSDPQFAFVNSIPAGAEEFIELHGVLLVKADWVQDRFIAIGRGGMERIKPDYSNWRLV